MRALAYKLAGVKNDKEFYKMFPDQESFMKKHGKAFKKAQLGASMGKAGGFMDKMGGVAGLTGLAGDAMNVVSTFKAQKKLVDSSLQGSKVAGISALAMGTPEEQIENEYIRPEDIQNTGEEFFPIYGVGTNMLTQDGGSYKKAQNGINQAMGAFGGPAGAYSAMANMSGMNVGKPKNNFGQWFGQSAQEEKTDAAGNVIQPGMNNGQMIAEGVNKIGGMFNVGQTDSAYGKAGKLIGETAGKFIPIPGADKILGAGLEFAGKVFDPQQKKIAKNQRSVDRSMTQMTGMGVGSQVQQMHNANVQDGDEYMAMDGIQVIGDGDLESSSYNLSIPGGGESLNIHGDAHRGTNGNDGGVALDVNGNQIKAEGGEVLSSLGDRDVIYGNLSPSKAVADMMGISAMANTKAKNHIKTLNKAEMRFNTSKNKTLEKIIELEPRTAFQKIERNSYDATIKGNDANLELISNEKQKIADWQEFTTSFADENKLVANDLAKGKYKVDKGAFKASNLTAKNGAQFPIAQNNGVVDKLTPEQIEVLKAKREAEIVGADKKEWFPGTPGSVETLPGVAGQGSNRTYWGSQSFQDAFAAAPAGKDFEWNDKMYAKEYANTSSGQGRNAVAPLTYNIAGMDPMNKYSKNELLDISKPMDMPYSAQPNKKFGIGDAMGIVNGILPYVRPSDQDNLDWNEMAGEMYSLSHNKLEPVKAQQFQPQLDVPYDISLQDQRNDVIAATRAASKFAGYNPAAQAMIAGQSYDPLNKINAEEFRFNQAKKDQVYSKNRDTVNQAKLTNLEILDQQSQRQSLARSNTKEAIQLALNSLSDKRSKHNLENKTLAIYENMYNYRFGGNNVAQNYNELAQFNMGGRPNTKGGSLAESIFQGEESLKAMKKRYKDEREAMGVNDFNPDASQNGKTLKKMPLIRSLKGYNY